MRTTVDLNSQLLKQATHASGIVKKTELLEEGLRRIVRDAAMQRIASLGGAFPDLELPRRRRPPQKSS